MRNSTLLIIWIILISLFSCEKNNNDSEITDGFKLAIGNSLIYNSNQIDFYDFSSHLIYLKTGNFKFSDFGGFSVAVDNEVIYTGQMLPLYSSFFPTGPFISCAPAFYDDFIIPIGFVQLTDSEGYTNEDPRNDIRVIEALKKYNQYREGLSLEIISLEKLSSNKLVMTFQITNHDSDALLILDPEKMGIDTFHYFTNGLTIVDNLNNSYTHRITPAHPDSYNSWDTDWFASIQGNATKIITITYNDFESFPSGQYSARFAYPGMGHQIDKEDLEQSNGRIWLGELYINKSIDIE
jgi:hypothetical protein